MTIEIQSAIISGVVGAVSAGVVSYIMLLSKEKGNNLKAFEVFEFFHKSVIKSTEQQLPAQQRDFPSLIEGYKEISEYVVKNGHSDTVRYFLEYGITLRELNGYVQDGSRGLVHIPIGTLNRLIKNATDSANNVGFLTRHLEM